MKKHLSEMSRQELREELEQLRVSSLREDQVFANVVEKQLRRRAANA